MYACKTPQQYVAYRHGFAPTFGRYTSVPDVNIKESEQGYELEVAAPGLSKEAFKLELEGRILTISASVQEEKQEGQGEYKRREFSYQSFSRSFELPKTIDTASIAASYEQGILKVSLPKMVPAKPEARQIEVA